PPSSTTSCSTRARVTSSRSMAATSPSSRNLSMWTSSSARLRAGTNARRLGRLAGFLGGLTAAGVASAHFQLLYTPNTALNAAEAMHFVMVFSHPAHGGPTMEMAEPQAFYVVSQRGDAAEPVRTDLKSSLAAIDWQTKDGPMRAYEAKL